MICSGLKGNPRSRKIKYSHKRKSVQRRRDELLNYLQIATSTSVYITILQLLQFEHFQKEQVKDEKTLTNSATSSCLKYKSFSFSFMSMSLFSTNISCFQQNRNEKCIQQITKNRLIQSWDQECIL